MSCLSAKVENGLLKHHFQRGALRLLPVPVQKPSTNLSALDESSEFFAFLSTLGGGMVNGDNYSQKFEIIDSKASLCSQSNQKIFKGTSSLKTDIWVNNSAFVFYNDANIFFENSNFTSQNNIHIDEASALFLLDGGFCAYAKNNFKAKLNTRIFLANRLIFNDAFSFENKLNLTQFLNHSCFYQIIIKGEIEAENIHSSELVVYSSKVKDLYIIRILSSDNDIAMNYINKIREKFVASNNMTYVQINQF